MNKFKKEILSVINKIFGKGQDWFSQLVNATDHTITKATIFLKEQKKQLNEYMVDREKLLSNIKNKQVEVEYLRKEIEKTNKGQTDRLMKLHNKLELRTEELIKSQQQYINVQQAIDEWRMKLTTLAGEKDQALSERNSLKSEYDHLQVIMKDNVVKQEQLTIELEELKRSQETFETPADSPNFDTSFHEKIEGKKEEIDRLNRENKGHEMKFKELETRLMEKVRLVSELSGQLQIVQSELDKNEQEIMGLQKFIHAQAQEIDKEKILSVDLKQEMIILQAKSASHEEEYNIALMEYESIKEMIRQVDDDYLQSIVESDEKIKRLEIDLLNEQNNLAIERENNGEPTDISIKTLEILKQEYEPRFETLYRESVFRPEFFKDFYALVPSDRLRAEASIVNLNYYFDLHASKIRPNEVTTRKGTKILEYPFGHDNIGRIYFKRAANRIQFYRISRTKNGKGKLNQDRVIVWLKANC